MGRIKIKDKYLQIQNMAIKQKNKITNKCP